MKSETYLLPDPIETDVRGDVAIAAEAGPVWPMKNWAYYLELKQRLERENLVVNMLPKRTSLLEHFLTCGITGASWEATVCRCTLHWEQAYDA